MCTLAWTMAECQNCGGHVTDRFERVFGTNDGDVFGCRSCMSTTAIRNGVPAKPDQPDPVDD